MMFMRRLFKKIRYSFKDLEHILLDFRGELLGQVDEYEGKNETVWAKAIVDCNIFVNSYLSKIDDKDKDYTKQKFRKIDIYNMFWHLKMDIMASDVPKYNGEAKELYMESYNKILEKLDEKMEEYK